MLTNTEIYFICWIEILVTETILYYILYYTVLRNKFFNLKYALLFSQ